MERVTAVLVMFLMNFGIRSLPIENGFSVKFNPLSTKEEINQKQFGALFAKIPQDFKPKDEHRREVLTKAYFPQKPDVPSGFSNQVAKLMNPAKYSYDSNNSRSFNQDQSINFLNLPIIRQPYDDYKILVATAPPNVHIDDENKRTIIYVIFPEEKSNDSLISNMPTIYFVNEKSHKNMEPVKKGPVDPILIVDSNRTVTGLKSKEVSKFVRFKNKWTSRYDYKVTR